MHATTQIAAQHFDVVIVGAGISGIGGAYHLQTLAPDRSYTILEGRDSIGGTWDLFRYPGIRSDSDMYTLGYSFRPWKEQKAIADGPSILRYVNEVADDYGIRKHIRFGHMVKRASWSSADALWTVEAEADGAPVRLTCNVLYMCSGYYDYAQGHSPTFEGQDDFTGQVIHPQFWPEDLDYSGKKVVVIGSGATAVTIVPEMARTAAHVTMLQRSPTYMISRPSEDAFANGLRKILPSKVAYDTVRWRNVLMQLFFFQLSRKKPELMKKQLRKGLEQELGPDYDFATHFTPSYNPWDQRLCLVPDADMFQAMREGKASVVTDHIDRFTATGIKLESGRELPADIIVTATGLKLQLMAGIAFTVDREIRSLSKSLAYKGMMFSDVPNLAYSFGYTNASWTLKADLTSLYLCRLLNHMTAKGFDTFMPAREADVEEVPFLDFTSGYVQRALDILPKQGNRHPWKVHQNYAKDLAALKYGKLEDGVMTFRTARVRQAA